LEHCIPEKFQTLIIEVITLSFVAEARVCQRFGEQKRVTKFVADTFL
jgi:hypothetical protein